MLSDYRIRTNIGVGLGVLAQLIGFIASQYVDIGTILWLAAILIYGGIILFIWGLWSYAIGKGYRGAWGLLGFLSLIGFVILFFFPDKHRSPKLKLT